MKSKKKKAIGQLILRNICFGVLLLGILSQFGYLTILNSEKFFARGYQKEYESLQRAYYSSQYVRKDAPGIIPDETFEAFAAGAFIKGMNPIHIVHDHPPLGRYILGLSIILFDNPRTFIVFFLALSFLGIFLITKLITKNIFVSLVPVAIFANEPLTLNKFSYAPLPEPIQLPFIIFGFYFFLLAIKSERKIIFYTIVSIFLGFVISIRFFVTGGLMLLSMMTYLVFFKRNWREAIKFGVTLPLALIILVVSYTRTIIDGYSVLQIFGVQKYILAYHKSAFTNAFSFWDLILFNRWHTWWGKNEILSDPQWRIYWPVSVIVSFVTLIIAIVKKITISEEEKVLFIWVVGYSLMLSTGYTSTRYFLPLLPFLYILLVAGSMRIVILIRNGKSS